MAQTTVSNAVQDVTTALTDLLDQTFAASLDVLKVFSKASSDLTSQFGPQIKSLNLPKFGGCCEIPPPCWMPRQLTPVTSHVCPGATASVCFQITNCGIDRRTITAQADQNATVTPTALDLEPFQRGVITVSYTVPAGSNNGDSTEIRVFVLGCKSYFLRWTVQTLSRGCACCHEIDIDDCPDLIHHWYDHFYCQRPCLPRGRGQ
jgi:hypothetical protein